MTITNALSAWLVDTPPLAEGQSLSLARNAMIDIAGCMVAGAGDGAHQGRTQPRDLREFRQGGIAESDDHR